MKTLQQTIDENKEFLGKSEKDRIEASDEYKSRRIVEKNNKYRWLYKAGFGKKK